MRRLILWLLRCADTWAWRRLGWHTGWCDSRQCLGVDIENCDETSFCRLGNKLFIAAFEIGELSEKLRKEMP